MDFGCGGNVAGSGGDEKGQGSQGSQGLQPKKSGDLEASMKVVKDSVQKEIAENSAKIRRMMQEDVNLEELVFPVFPEIVWEMIIDKMNLSSDLMRLCLAIPQLEPLVKKRKKIIFLFENVLPLVCKHISRKDIKNYRLVCQKWNEDVCALVANWNVPNLLPDTSSSKPPYSFQGAYSFEDHRRIQKFLKKMADHSGNPLFGRFLRLSVDMETKWKHFWKSVLKLVGKFGEHVWNLQIRFSLDSTDPVAVYKVLQETLIQLPNLKYLSTNSFFSGCGPSQTDMSAHIASSPLPPLPNLESLTLTSCHGETGMMSAFSSLFSPQIRQLLLLGLTFGDADIKDEWFGGLISLEHLRVRVTSAEEYLRLLQFPSSNLKTLCLHFDKEKEPPVSFTSEQLCNLLDKFSRLERLYLGSYWQVERSSFSSSTVRFSGLKTLGIEVGVDHDDLQHNLDFLLWFPSLKCLKIKVISGSGTNQKTDQHSTLKLRNYLCTGQMLDSNVWTLIPSLDVLEITCKGKYTREMFQNRRG